MKTISAKIPLFLRKIPSVVTHQENTKQNLIQHNLSFSYQHISRRTRNQFTYIGNQYNLC